MKIKDILDSGKLMISCEIFPPREDADFERVEHAAMEIACLSPSYISVTYGASGGTSSHTVDIASKVQNEWGGDCAGTPDLRFLHQGTGGGCYRKPESPRD